MGFGIIGFANALSKGIVPSLLVRDETCITDSRIMWKRKIGLLSAIVACALLPAHFARAEAIAVRSVAPEAFGDGQQPQVTVTPAGVIIVVFAKGQSIYSVQSSDQGENFSAPVKIADLPGLMVGMRRGPRVAATDKRIIVSAPGPELASYLSQDAGQTWKPAGKINDKPGAASEGLQNITALPDGSFYAVWLDSRNK
ncbi:MAG: exo-alpha-sialidase, partial [Chthoniobacterales bacterium]|nr:exo-alpha-sialidase [Chthoniobacterales bacterium]